MESSTLELTLKWSFFSVQGPKKLEVFILPAAICSWKEWCRNREGRAAHV